VVNIVIATANNKAGRFSITEASLGSPLFGGIAATTHFRPP